MRTLCATLLVSAVLMGCGGGGTTTTPPTPTPQAQVNGIVPSQALDANTPGYAGDTLTIRATVQGTLATIAWDFGGGATPDDAMTLAPVVELGAPGAYHGRVTVTDANGLTDAFTFDFTVRDPSFRIHDFVPAGTVGQLGEVVQISAQVDGTVTDWLWSTTAGEFSFSDVAKPFIKWTAAGDLTVTLQVTLDDATILTRDFSVTVAPTNWQLAFEQPFGEILDTEVLSDGSVALLLLPKTGGRRTMLMRSIGADLEQPASWNQHNIGLEGGFVHADLDEGDGRLGVLYLVQTAIGGGGYEGGGNLRHLFMAVSSTASPLADTDWQVHQVHEAGDVHLVGLASVPGNGWRALIHHGQTLLGATTTAAAPSVPGDWTHVTMRTPFSANHLYLGEFGGQLLAGIHGLENEILLSPGYDITQLGQAISYAFPGNEAQWSMSGGRLTALINSGSAHDVTIGVAKTLPPRSMDDWTIYATGLQCSIVSEVALDLGNGQLTVVGSEELMQSVSISYKQFTSLTRSLADLSGPWDREFLTDQAIRDPFFVPTGQGNLFGFSNADQSITSFLGRPTG